MLWGLCALLMSESFVGYVPKAGGSIRNVLAVATVDCVDRRRLFERRRSVAGVLPGPADPDADLKRHVHLDGRAHLLAYQRLDGLTLARRVLS